MSDEIVIQNYDPRWPALYEAERPRILAALGDLALEIEHVGSTAVPGLAAKPIVDIVVVVPAREDFDAVSAALRPLGYLEWPYPDKRFHMKLVDGVRTHHVHAVPRDSDFLDRHVLFRDYLRTHPETAREYLRLKQELATRHSTDREAYTDAKAEFVRRVEGMARREASTNSGGSDE